MGFISGNKIIVSLLLLAALITIGAAGFMLIDSYSAIDALYMSVITVTTVGFGEINPLSDLGRLFTTGLILFGFVVLGFVGHSMVESLLESVWRGNALEKKMKKKIQQLTKHHIICGFGRVGEVAAEQLHAAGESFVVIESSEKAWEILREKGYLYLEGDATRETMLLAAGIKKASGLLALLSSDPHNLFIVLTARELNPTLHIIARSEEKQTEKKILRAGADSIISPFDSAGKRIAENVIAATKGGGLNTESTVSMANLQPEWIQVKAGSSMIGREINKVSRTMGREVFGLRRKGTDTLLPPADLVLEEKDWLLVMSDTTVDITMESRIIPKKIVIVDDNPVIVRLYSRLFQRAGFHPVTAENGDEGLELILKEQPDVAVIDLMLPGLSGKEICEKVRATESGAKMKIIIFTADDDPETSRQCLESGADEVVVKSAEASQIIGQVVSILRNG